MIGRVRDGGKTAAGRGARGWVRPDLAATPCGARTRAGGSCRSPAVRGKARCRMHGGAAGAGAPRGNRNAWKHGYWSAAERDARRRTAALVAAATRILEEQQEPCGQPPDEGPAGPARLAAGLPSGADGDAWLPLPLPDT